MVRHAAEEENIVTLDGETRSLTSEDWVIAKWTSASGFSWSNGGLGLRELRKTTSYVALESALFDPISIRRTARTFQFT